MAYRRVYLAVIVRSHSNSNPSGQFFLSFQSSSENTLPYHLPGPQSTPLDIWLSHSQSICLFECRSVWPGIVHSSSLIIKDTIKWILLLVLRCIINCNGHSVQPSKFKDSKIGEPMELKANDTSRRYRSHSNALHWPDSLALLDSISMHTYINTCSTAQSGPVVDSVSWVE